MVNSTGLPGMLGQLTSLTVDVPSQGLAGAFTKYYYDAGLSIDWGGLPERSAFQRTRTG